MFRIDPKQAVLDHVARQGATGAQAALSDVADQVVRAPVETNYPGAVIVGVAQLLEALLLATLGLGIYGAYVADGDPVFYLPLVTSVVLMANVLFNAGRTHRIAAYRSVLDQTGRVLAAWSLIFTLVIVGTFLLKAHDAISRVWLVSWYALGAAVRIAAAAWCPLRPTCPACARPGIGNHALHSGR